MTNRDDGFVLVMFAIFLAVLLGVAGFSADLGNWYLRIGRAQNAADAAALAGAVFLPADPGKAEEAAKASLANNRVPAWAIDSAVIRPTAKGSGELFVRVETEAENAFLPFLGLDRVSRFSVRSTARWQPGLGIGNFSNVLGNEPEDAARPNSDLWQSAERRAAQGSFWLDISGGDSDKRTGDRFGASRCGSGASGCSGGTNSEQRVDPDGSHIAGFTYVIDAAKGQPGTSLRVQAYDPALVFVGEKCEGSGPLFSASGGNVRYQAQRTTYCSGDGDLNASAGSLTATYFQIFDAATGAPASACPTERRFDAYHSPGSSQLADPQFRAAFHDWVTLCNLPYDTDRGSKYILRVRTDLNKGGHNAFSLRAALTDGPTGLADGGNVLLAESQRAVRVYAEKDLLLSANFEETTTQFAIASIPPSYAGQTVSLELFDLGDASEPATLSLISSSDQGALATADCSWKPPGSTTSESLPNCQVPNVSRSTGFQAQLFTITWQIPANYSCDVTGATPNSNCYVFLRLAYPPGASVNDRTTWSAGGERQPLRIVPSPKEVPAP